MGRTHGALTLTLALIALAIAACAAASAAAPLQATPRFRLFGVEQGLPSGRVYKIAQDHEGYLWIATEDGLARYDGTGFRTWRVDPGDRAGLAGNRVQTLLVDAHNRLWLASEGAGLSLWQPRSGSFRHYRRVAGDPASLPSDDVWAIAPNGAQRLWLGTYAGGLVDFDPDSGRGRTERHAAERSDSLSSDTVLSLLPDASGAGRLWVGTDRGLDRREPDGRYVHVAFPAGAAPTVAALLRDGDGVLAGTHDGLFRVGPDLAVTALPLAAPSTAIFSMAREADGTLWLGTRRGLLRRAPDGTLQVLLPQAGVAGSLAGNSVYDLLQDHEGGLWLASIDGGLGYLTPQWRNFSVWRKVPEGGGLSSRTPLGVHLAADGAVWLSGADGVDRLDPASGVVESFSERLGGATPRPEAVLLDRRGRIWLGSGRGMRRYDRPGAPPRDFFSSDVADGGMPRGMANRLAEDGSGALWALVAGTGLVRIDAADRLQLFRAGAVGGPRDGDINQIEVDAQGLLWVAHAQGLDRCAAPCEAFAAVAGAPAATVHAVDFAPDGTLWLASFGSLEHYARSGEGLRRLEHFDAADGWPALIVLGLRVDHGGRVWASSSRGLYAFDPARRTVRQYGAADGLSAVELHRFGLHRDAAGRLYAGARDGLVGFDPLALRDNPLPPPLRRVSASVQRAGVRQELDVEAPLALRWNDVDLRVAYRALSYAGTPRYQFRLDGLESDWFDGGGRGERELGRLAPGRYALHVRAANAAGVWSAPAEPLRLVVATPPWLRWWAWLAYVLGLLLVLGLSLRAWRRRLQRRHVLALAQQRRELAEQSSAAKSDFLAHMGHEIRTPMTGLLGMTELLLRSPLAPRQREQAEAILGAGQHMLRLVNDALDLARIEAGRLTLERDPLDPAAVLREVAGSLAALAQAKGLALTCSIDAGVPAAIWGDAGRLRQILFNLASNAIKFTAQGGVVLGLAVEADRLCYRVRDSGPGLSAAEQARLFERYVQTPSGRRAGGSGLGLAICRELAGLMGGAIRLDSVPGQGSEFRLCLPWQAAPAAATAPAADDGCRGALRLLLVEDDATAADALRGLLESLGHTVEHAGNGLAALARLAQGGVDLVLCDLDLPGLDGLQLTRTWRAREAAAGAPRLPLLALTARSDAEAEAQARAAGMDGFQRKPVTAELLQRLLQPWLPPGAC